MKLIRIAFTILFICTFFSGAKAQKNRTNNWCSSDEHAAEMRKSDPNFSKTQAAIETYIADFAKTYNPKSTTGKKATIIIPVVVHNITHSGGQGYVSKSQIEAQLNTLNQDYNRTNPDTGSTRAFFAPYAASIDIEFRLAHIDPNGDCTEGIVRAESPFSNSTSTSMAENVKSVSYWPTSGTRAYFNIWVIDEIEDNGTSFVAGYAQFPGSNNNGTYGVVMADQSFGGGNRTLTHELGHCLNLLHTFNYGSCNSGSDQCSDTPRVLESNFNCDPNRNTCSNIESFFGSGVDPIDQWENYMSYANCQNMYTLQQETRIMAILNNTNTNQGVAHLYTTSNKNNTGVNDPYGPVICAPIAEFDYDKEYICEGASVTFSDLSYNATPTTWNWVFNGGTPNTSGVSNPTITYNTAGVYSVTHEPGTTAGTDVITKNSIITVSSLVADYVGPIVDGFENTTQFGNDWRIESAAGQAWQNTTAAATTGSRSVRVRNTFTNTDGQIDELISPSFDISATSTKTMTFKQAFAQKGTGNTDRLLVYYSTDCGGTWQLQLPLTTASLTTAPPHTTEFVPTSSEWTLRTINLNSIGSATNVRFKFEFESGGGNNIYIDDINIGGATGIDDLDQNIGSFNVYPNPTSSSAKISFHLLKDVENLSITVKNAIGQNVTNVVNGSSFNMGKYTLNIDEQRKLAPGIYLVEFNADNNIKVQKLIVQ